MTKGNPISGFCSYSKHPTLRWICWLLLLPCACTYYHLEKPVIPCSGSSIKLSIQTVIDASTCSAKDGAISVSASGVKGPALFSIDSVTFQSDSTFTGLGIGNYTITLKDSLGCKTSIVGQVNNLQIKLSISTTITDNTGCPNPNGVIVVTASGGAGTYHYKLGAGPSQTANSFSSLKAGTYSLSVTDDNNCPTTTSVIINRKGPSFKSDVQPIIKAYCATAGCHDSGSTRPQPLSSYNQVLNQSSGIATRVVSKNMPPNGSTDLTQNQINIIKCWVDDGSPNN